MVAFLLATLSALLCGCNKPEFPVDYFSWTNPVTGTVVQLPEGWRHSPETARLGATTVGYFSPTFSNLFGRYGHLTLHYEDLTDRSLTLEQYVGNFVDYLRPQADHLSEPVFERTTELQTARLAAELPHQNRQMVFRVRFWTSTDGEYWYAVTESLLEDSQFAQHTAPLLDLLQQSTRIKP